MDIIKKNKFIFSVVMAVYNAEKYLEEAVESLINQDIGFKNHIQIILINDGSEDKSGEICNRYQKKHPENIIAIHKENGGAASARNMGLSYAEGSLINFMDSDDKLSTNTFSKVFNFYIDYGHITDVIAIPLHFFDAFEGEHWQNWKFSRGTRLIDLTKEPATTNMSTAASFIHNRRKKDICFDSRLATGEDTKVLLKILYPMLTLGVVHDAKYMYRRESGGSSLIQTSTQKKEWYLNFVPYLVKWAYDYYMNKLNIFPGFVQYTLLADIQWRISDTTLKSNVLNKEEMNLYKKELFGCIKLFEERYILTQKRIVGEQKIYILTKKYEKKPTIKNVDNDMYLYFSDEYVWRQSESLINVYILNAKDGFIEIVGKTRLYKALDYESNKIDFVVKLGSQEVKCDLIKNTHDNNTTKDILSSYYFNAKIKIDDFQEEKVTFLLRLQDTEIRFKNLQIGEHCPFSSAVVHSHYFFDNKIVFYDTNSKNIIIKKVTKKEKRQWKVKFIFTLLKTKDIAAKKALISRFFCKIIKSFVKKPVYLISDRINKAGDNGEALFEYLNNETKVKPYFAIYKNSSDYKRLSKIGKVISFGGWKYKIISLISPVIISSHGERGVFNPFYSNIKYYSDLMYNRKTVFLQHGVTIHDLSSWISRYGKNFDLVISATNNEFNAFMGGNYLFTEKQVKLTGFPRYDKLEDNKSNIIAILPTWRQYLTSEFNYFTGEMKLIKNFKNSAYYMFFNNLLNNERLIATAKKYNYKIEFLPHPNMANGIKYFNKNEYVSFLDKDTLYSQILSKTSLMITDYSSVSFDFAYLKKPIIYSQFDKDELYTEGHVYSKGYFSYEDHGFGEVTYTLETTVDLIIEYIKNNCQIKEKYLNRTVQTFKYMDKNNSKRVYEEIQKLIT